MSVIGQILTAAKLAQSVAELTGLVESMGVKIDRLVQSDLNAGLLALQQASESSDEQISLLREARSHLNKAVTLEKSVRLIVASVALAAVHHHLGDQANATMAAKRVLSINPIERKRFVFAAAKDAYVTPHVETLEALRDSVDSTGDMSGRLSRAYGHTAKTTVYMVSGAGTIVLARNLFFGDRESKMAYKRKLIREIIDSDEEIRRVVAIQEEVAESVGGSIEWMESIEFSKADSEKEQRRLIRPKDGRLIAGVCCGIAARYDWSVKFVRTGFVITSIMPILAGLLAYVILSLLIPEEES